jgi:hypothetical protein
MMVGTAGDEVLFRGRGFRTVTQLFAEGFLAVIGVWLFLGGVFGLTRIAGQPDAWAAASFLIGLAMLYLLYLIYFKGKIWHRKHITVYRSWIDVNGSYVRWDQVKGVYHDVAEELTWLGPYNYPARYELVHTVEVESIDGRSLTFRLKERDFQKFLNAVVEALGIEESEKRVRKR